MPSFFTSYVLAAMSTVKDLGSLTPANIAPPTLAKMKDDCETFQLNHKVDLAFLDEGRAGQNFWMARNGGGIQHGIPGTRAQRLTDAAKAFGPYRLYVVNGELIYGEQG